jgi:hypothetical protein
MRIFDQKGRKTDRGKNCILMDSITCIIRRISLGMRRMRWAGHVERMGKGKVFDWILVGRPEGKRPLGRPKCR